MQRALTSSERGASEVFGTVKNSRALPVRNVKSANAIGLEYISLEVTPIVRDVLYAIKLILASILILDSRSLLRCDRSYTSQSAIQLYPIM